MKFANLLILIVLSACGAKKSSFEYGKTKVADLIQEKGPPIKEEEIPVKDGKILYYPDNEKYQVNNGIVTNSFKNPKGEQRVLLYWKHKFKDCETKESKLPSKYKGHSPSEYEFFCGEQGKSVIYSEGSEFVSRIVEYEKK